MTFSRQAARRCVSLARAVLIACLGAGCTANSNDELLWGNCCALKIADEKSGSQARDTLLAWSRHVNFNGNGDTWDGSKAWRKAEFGRGLASFLETHPGAQARDYLADLGMRCSSISAETSDLTRCEVELSVWVRCTAKLGWLFPAPVPKEMRKPIAAILQMTIDVSASDILDSSTRMAPLPGGRLCER